MGLKSSGERPAGKLRLSCFPSPLPSLSRQDRTREVILIVGIRGMPHFFSNVKSLLKMII